MENLDMSTYWSFHLLILLWFSVEFFRKIILSACPDFFIDAIWDRRARIIVSIESRIWKVPIIISFVASYLELTDLCLVGTDQANVKNESDSLSVRPIKRKEPIKVDIKVKVVPKPKKVGWWNVAEIYLK